MKATTRILALILALIMCASCFVACDGGDGDTTTAPDTSAPDTTAPDTTAADTTAADTTAADTTAADTTAADTTAADTTAADTTAPETTAPETTAPETTAPETTAPETTAPETTAPDTTAPDTTAPETTAPHVHTPETIKGKAATCTKDGLTDGVKCATCKTVLTAQTKIAAKGHTPETVKGKAATCTNDGLTDGVKCATCKTVLTAQTKIAAKGHSYTSGVCSACGKDKANESLEFALSADGKSYYVTGIGSCTDTDVIIPATYNGKPVTSIELEAFWGCDSMTSITIPSSITRIGGEAFSDCTSLARVYISDLAAWCGILFVGLLSSPFYYGAELYLNGEKITDLVIPNTAPYVKNYAFLGCSSITSIHVPVGVDGISAYAFYCCTSLKSITVDEKNIVYRNSIGNCLIDGSKTLVLGCSTSVIPDDGRVETIGKLAFANAPSLTTITIPDSVTEISDSAFSACTALKSVTIGKNVKSIGEYAFVACRSLTSITFNGTKAQWNAISKASNWNQASGKYTIHCTDGDISK